MRSFLTSLLIVSAAAVLRAQPPVSPWEKEIAAIEQRTKALADPQGRILFVGSSSIRLWNLEQSFPDWKLLNHGFGGSQTSDSVAYFDRLVRPFAPRIVILYAGDNDLAKQKSPAEVTGDFAQFNALLKAALPKTRLVFIAVKPSPSRSALIEKQRQTNAAIKAIIEQEPARLSYFDSVTPLLDSAGEPRPELFKADRLHLNNDGYALWTKLLREHVAQLK
jgi:lysophospholipase L1-like esterase